MKLYPFSEVITDVTSKFRKIKSSEYKSKGRFKIIDQGHKEVAGYTDNESLINKTHLPIIVFGDHTRAVKYESSPVALGADGTKALLVNPMLADTLYVYYYLRTISLKEAGYSRHFKFLKRLDIPIPELDGEPDFDKQRHIAHLLGKVEALIAGRKQNMQQLDDLLKSVFLDMFGDPVRNEMGWDKRDFGTIISGMRNGLSPSKSGTNKGRVYTLSAITGDFFQEIFKEDNFSQIHDKYFPAASDFLVCRGNGNINLVGKGYFFPGVSEDVIFPDTIIAVSIQPNAVNRYFFEALWKTRFIRQQIEKNARTTNGAHKINQGVIEKIKIIQPPADIQHQFASVAERIEALKSRYHQSLADLEGLYGALSQKAFKGELDLSRVSLPTKGPDIAEEEKTDGEENQPMEPLFELPAPDKPAVLQTAEGRKTLLGGWLNAWLQQLGDAPFSAQAFMDAARQRLWELAEDEAPDWSVPEYDELKNWVFGALSQGRLDQGYDDANNRVQVTEAKG